jgi:hypothetical protein
MTLYEQVTPDLRDTPGPYDGLTVLKFLKLAGMRFAHLGLQLTLCVVCGAYRTPSVARSRVSMSASEGKQLSWAWEHTWASPRWNWGYASGEAHDRAAAIRSRLRTAPAREQWMNAAPPVGEQLLALALAVQRSENCGDRTVVSAVMAELARGKLAAEADTCDALHDAMQAARTPALAGVGQVALDSPERARAVLRAALVAVGFVERGM